MKQPRSTVLYASERKFFYLAVTFVLSAVFLYVYFICVSVVHVVARTETDRGISQMQARINDLESRYIEAKQAITFDNASERGFVSTKDKVYITRSAGTLVLSNNDES